VSDVLANLIAKKFIARSDVKAVQRVLQDGTVIYMPHLDKSQSDPDAKRLPWTRADLNAHLANEATFGHYLLNTDSKCKLFVIDIDLAKTGYLPRRATGYQPQATDGNDVWVTDEQFREWESSFEPVDDLRAAWLNRADPGRTWMKRQFKLMAHMLVKTIHEGLEIPCAVAYSGNKGIHVYGFTGWDKPTSANLAREGARTVLESLDCFEPLRGENFFRHTNQDPVDGFPNLEIEIFPKQDTLEGKDLGNLVRLPLGRNLKNPKDQTFFIDMTTSINEMKPLDPEWALTEGAINPWRRAGE
jgi:hypothetical protein